MSELQAKIKALIPDPQIEYLTRIATMKGGPKWKLISRKKRGKKMRARRVQILDVPMIEHRYPVRPNVYATILVPEDFNSREARRLAQAVQCYPMGNNYDPDQFVPTVSRTNV